VFIPLGGTPTFETANVTFLVEVVILKSEGAADISDWTVVDRGIMRECGAVKGILEDMGSSGGVDGRRYGFVERR
jgi:hypothetical protein